MFSVLLPVYNHEPFLAEALFSAVGSPLVSEVLVADDGSRDGSGLLLAALRSVSPKVRDLTLSPPRNTGAHATLNRLAAAASCKWLAVLNSDDVFPAARFEIIANRLRQDPFDAAFGDIAVIDAASRPVGHKRAALDPQYPFPREFDPAAMLRSGQLTDLLASQNFIATTSNLVFTRELFAKIGGFAPYRYVHDWDFALRASVLGRVRYIPQPLTCYRVHGSNTIRESASAVDREVRRLFARFERDFPEAAARPAFRAAVAGNQYLNPPPVISLRMPGDAGAPAYAQRLREHIPDLRLIHGVDEPPPAGHVYAPRSSATALPPDRMVSVWLTLAVQNPDFVAVSRSLADPPRIAAGDLADSIVIRSGRKPEDPLRGRVLRLAPGEPPNQALPANLFHTLDPFPRPMPAPNTLTGVGRTGKPVVFVLPALFAVGGVERLVIDMMRQLRDRYDFVVITVERLNENLGSLEPAAEGIPIGFYNLGEIATPDLFPLLLERLRDVYDPALVWTPNASPWQCDHAASIRRIFARSAIVDQQCYDTDAGWIARYHEPGLRMADRYVAINTRIRDAFITRYRLDPARIDLIYHSVDLERFGGPPPADGQKRELARKYNLPWGKVPLYGWVGRFTDQKRPIELLEFIRARRDAGDPAHFVMVGDGPLGAACDGYVAANQLANVSRVKFCDRMNEIFALLSGLLIASRYEGLPISMLEAMSMGVPVLATEVGDIRLILDEYGCGVTVGRWEDFAAAYASWAAEIRSWQEKARQAAPAILSRFGSPSVANAYDRCFRRAMTEHASVRIQPAG